jgi:hypothetical protein
MENRKMIERRRISEPTVTSERLSPTREEFTVNDYSDDADSLSQANGSGEVTAASPLPLKLAALERLISAALTEPRTASDLSDLLEQTDLAVVAVTEHAKLENERALDPLASPDPQAARQQAEDAAFMANRLRTMRPRLLQRYQQVTSQEEVDSYRAKQSQLAPVRDTLERELRETYEAATAKLVDLFTRIRAFQQRAQQQLGNPPPGVHVLQAIDGLRVLDNCVLPEFKHPDRNAWPPPSTFAAEFAQSMGVPLHAGAAWCDPDYQERQRAEREAEQQRNAAYHELSAREQEVRQNRELKEQFLARQRA